MGEREGFFHGLIGLFEGRSLSASAASKIHSAIVSVSSSAPLCLHVCRHLLLCRPHFAFRISPPLLLVAIYHRARFRKLLSAGPGKVGGARFCHC